MGLGRTTVGCLRDTSLHRWGGCVVGGLGKGGPLNGVSLGRMAVGCVEWATCFEGGTIVDGVVVADGGVADGGVADGGVADGVVADGGVADGVVADGVVGGVDGVSGVSDVVREGAVYNTVSPV